LRYETGDFFNGHGYEGPLSAEAEAAAEAAAR
jgi:hypothetical protein